MLKAEITVTILSLNHKEEGNGFYESEAVLLESSRLRGAREMKRHGLVHRNLRTRVIVWRLRVYITPPGDQSSAHSTHIKDLNPASTALKLNGRPSQEFQFISEHPLCPQTQPTVLTTAIKSDFLLASFPCFSSWLFSCRDFAGISGTDILPSNCLVS